MKERSAKLLDFDLHLAPGTDSAVLSIGITRYPVPPNPHRSKETIRMMLTIEDLRALADALGQAVARLGPATPSAPGMH